ncbi:MAG TPA: metal ABC transporter permease, partial [Phycisphaerae bacterium]|nr:metal ABC transporter permease [Phycisphaerae bacterium]
RSDVLMVAILDIVIVGVAWACYHKLLAVCFDEEFARLRGIRVEAYYLLLLTLTALTVVVLLKVVGIIMVIALLTLPAATAGYFSRTLLQMMTVATLLGIALTTTGLVVSFSPSLPVGATTILLAGAVYLAAMTGKRLLTRR